MCIQKLLRGADARVSCWDTNTQLICQTALRCFFFLLVFFGFFLHCSRWLFAVWKVEKQPLKTDFYLSRLEEGTFAGLWILEVGWNPLQMNYKQYSHRNRTLQLAPPSTPLHPPPPSCISKFHLSIVEMCLFHTPAFFEITIHNYIYNHDKIHNYIAYIYSNKHGPTSQIHLPTFQDWKVIFLFIFSPVSVSSFVLSDSEQPPLTRLPWRHPQCIAHSRLSGEQGPERLSESVYLAGQLWWNQLC